jgi:predicted PurR-regulated permease PerM
VSAAPAPAGARSWIPLVALLVGGAAAYFLRGLALPLLLATLVAYGLEPLVEPLVERGISRGATVVSLFAILFLLVASLVSWLAPAGRAEAAIFIDELPNIQMRLEATAQTSVQELHAAQPWTRQILPLPKAGWTDRVVDRQKDHLGELASHAGALLFVGILVPVFAFFLLRDGRKLLDHAMDALPPDRIETSMAMWCEIYRILGRYLRGITIESCVVGSLAALGLALLGVPVPLLIGLFTALVNPIPYVGALASLSLASLVALGNQLGVGKVTAIALLYLGIRLLDDFVIVPLTVGGSVHLHPFVVILSILAGEELLGIFGMVVAVPTVTIVKEVVRLLIEHRRRRSANAAIPGAEHFVC